MTTPINTDLATSPHKMKLSRECWEHFLESLSSHLEASALADDTSEVLVEYSPLELFDVARITFSIQEQQHEAYTAFFRSDVPAEEMAALTHKIVFQTVAYYQEMNAVPQEPQDE